MASTHQSGLKAAFEEFQYAMTVEWDQKDAVFAKEATQNLKNEIMNLEAQGLTKEDLILFARTEIKNQKFSQDLEQVLNAGLSPLAAKELLIKSLKKPQMAGASWSADPHLVRNLLIMTFFITSIVVVTMVVWDIPGAFSH